MANNFRELFRWLLPSWLTEGEGGLVAFSLATMKDIYLERVSQGLVARFPSYAAGDALAEIGRERGLKPGFLEPQENYVSRLQAWRYPKTHRVRGTAFALLREAQVSLGPGSYVRTIDASGNEHVRDANGVETYSYGNFWIWDGEPIFGRFWLEARDVPGAAANTYTDISALWTRTDGLETLGIDGVSARHMSDLRDLVNQAPQWKPAGTRAMWLIISLSGDPFVPTDIFANYQRWSKIESETAVPFRDSVSFRYVQLNTEPYPGDPTRFAKFVTLPTGVVYAGDPTNAAAWLEIETPLRLRGATIRPRMLYRGSSDFPDFVGDPAAPIGVRLPDDGDFIPEFDE